MHSKHFRHRKQKSTFLALAALLPLLFLPATICYGVDIPHLQARVTDNAHMLDAATKTQLDTVLGSLETTDSTQIAVLTIPSLQGESIENYSLRVAEKWGLGQKGTDNGALLLISKADRKIRIEVGYGLEGRLTDLVASQIIRNVIRPNFKNGEFNQGVIAGVSAMIAAVRGEFKAEDHANNDFVPADMLVFVFCFLIVIFMNLGKISSGSRRRRKNSRTGNFFYNTSTGTRGSSSGGFGGFSGGGGGFGGGGASGGW